MQSLEIDVDDFFIILLSTITQISITTISAIFQTVQTVLFGFFLENDQVAR